MRVVIAEHTVSTVVALLVLGVGILGAGLLIGPPTDTGVERTNVQSVTVGHDVSATVTGNSTVYERGTTLQNRPLYVVDAAPSATVSVSVSAPAKTDATATTRLVYEARAADSGETIWQNSTTLNTVEVDSSDGYDVSMNVSAVRDRVREVQGEFGGSATVDARLVTTVQYDTDRYSGSVDTTSSVEFPTATAYRLPAANETATNATEVTTTKIAERRTVAGSGMSVIQIGLIVGGLLSLGGAVVVWVGCRRMDAEVERVRLDHYRYHEFITPVNEAGDSVAEAAETDSLEALVNYAANADRQVFAATAEGLYIVTGESPVKFVPADGIPSRVGAAYRDTDSGGEPDTGEDGGE